MRTPSQTVGPYYTIGLCRRLDNELSPDGVELVGTLYDGRGAPITDGMVEIWDGRSQRWGRSGTHPDGDFSFRLGMPAAANGAPHIDVFVFARGLLRHQLTRMYFPGESAANDADPVLGAILEADRETLVARSEDGRLRFDIRLQGAGATVFFEH